MISGDNEWGKSITSDAWVRGVTSGMRAWICDFSPEVRLFQWWVWHRERGRPVCGETMIQNDRSGDTRDGYTTTRDRVAVAR